MEECLHLLFYVKGENTMAKEKILIVDDEEHIIELLKFNLLNAGYEVLTANDGIDAVRIAKAEKPSLLLLDLMLPGIDGFDVCKEIKRNNEMKNTSIVMLTAKGEELDKILGLELGADDYITKPFSVRELLARVKAVLRRTNSFNDAEEEIYDSQNLKVDFERHEVSVNGEKVDLTLKEFELLQILIKNKGKILKRETLLDKIWGYEYIGETRTVDVHIRYLRKKIEEDDKNPRFIETIRGVGYRFNPAE
ncbi:alkaline phosphatase synthesis transcriptional regulatory protein PhoP [Clostridium puniceum]|uniref:Stage 0 sporulation protein A homolog n=2 Tax=Clostridium puniceum TaxID=29367 RepID=A0A1S8T8S9_9CLOT|nr:alkaline phosphatase synthesis transcriptional regulatory protein PhoP [Clostridium puniceum]